MISGDLAVLTMLAQAITAVTESNASVLQFVGQLGGALALGIGATGSALGICAAGRAAAGAWAKEARAGVGLRFTYIILLGLPLSQTLYAMIVMNRIKDALFSITPEGAVMQSGMTADFAGILLAAGIAVGLAEMFSAWTQGIIGAAGIRAMSEGEGKGFAFILIAMGIVETVGIFAMVFMLGMIPTVS